MTTWVEQSMKRVGVVSATIGGTITADTFTFNLDPGQIVKRYDVVTVPVSGEERTHGVITEIVTTTEVPHHLANSWDTELLTGDAEPQTKVSQVTTATAAVLSNSLGLDMPVPQGAAVYLSTEHWIHEALGIDWSMGHHREDMIPIGSIEQSNDQRATVYINRTFLLGDEGAHLNASGIPGIAGKTSCLTFMAQSILQSEAHADHPQTAVIIFNSKKADLLRLHEPREDFSAEDAAQWRAMGLEPSPFTNVRYFLPRGRRGIADSFLPLPPDYALYAYTLPGTAGYLDLLFLNIVNETSTVESVTAEMTAILHDTQDPDHKLLTTWESLLQYVTKKSQARDTQGFWRAGIRQVSLALFMRYLRRTIGQGNDKLFVSALAANEREPMEVLYDLRPGDVFVFDIANLEQRPRELVVGSIMRAIADIKTDPAYMETFPEKVIIYLDELGKYAPRGDRGNALTEIFIDIAERGRSSGEILFGAQQSRTSVHSRIIDNMGNSVIGRTGSAELSTPGYSSIPPTIKATIPRLIHGEVVWLYPEFRQPVKINFPKPAWE